MTTKRFEELEVLTGASDTLGQGQRGKRPRHNTRSSLALWGEELQLLAANIGRSQLSGKVCAIVFLALVGSLSALCLTGAKASDSRRGRPHAFLFEYVTVTLLQEMLKFIVSFVVLSRSLGDDSRAYLSAWSSCVNDSELLLFSVPAVLYCFEVNFQYIILEFLTPAELSILWNFKICATAALLSTLLRRRYSQRQLVALVLLVAGTTLPQFADLAAKSSILSGTTSALAASPSVQATVGVGDEADVLLWPSKLERRVVGSILAIFGSSVAALANVSSEWVVKRKVEDSLHLQNTRLYLFGVICNSVALLGKAVLTPSSPVHGPAGLFTGYSGWVWVTVLAGWISGLAVSVALKFFDNIVVVFAHALSMLVVALVSTEYFGQALPRPFLLGGVMIAAAVIAFYADEAECDECKPQPVSVEWKEFMVVEHSQELTRASVCEATTAGTYCL